MSDESVRRKNIDELRVFFDFEEYAPNIGSTGLVDVVISFMKDYPTYVVTIEGHADERDTREFNLALGERRATTIKNMMIADGIDSNRIKTVSYGKERPEYLGSNSDAWRKNRRVVFVLN